MCIYTIDALQTLPYCVVIVCINLNTQWACQPENGKRVYWVQHSTKGFNPNRNPALLNIWLSCKPPRFHQHQVLYSVEMKFIHKIFLTAPLDCVLNVSLLKG